MTMKVVTTVIKYFLIFQSAIETFDISKKKMRGVDTSGLRTYPELRETAGAIKPLLSLAKCTNLIIFFLVTEVSKLGKLFVTKTVYANQTYIFLKGLHTLVTLLYESTSEKKENSLNSLRLLCLHLLIMFHTEFYLSSFIILPVEHYLYLKCKDCEVEKL